MGLFLFSPHPRGTPPALPTSHDTTILLLFPRTLILKENYSFAAHKPLYAGTERKSTSGQSFFSQIFFHFHPCTNDKIITNNFFFFFCFFKEISLADFCQGGLQSLLQAAKKQECKDIYLCLGKDETKIIASELAQITPNKYKTSS